GVGAHSLRAPEFPGARRADQPPRHEHQGDDRPLARRLRGYAALRVTRPPFPGQALEPRARARSRRSGPLRRRLPGIRRPQRPRSAVEASIVKMKRSPIAPACLVLVAFDARAAVADSTVTLVPDDKAATSVALEKVPDYSCPLPEPADTDSAC